MKKLLVPVNILLFISVLFQSVSGLIMLFFSIEPEWMDSVHSYNGLAMAILVVLHIILNWTWIKTQIFGIKKS